MVRGVGAKLRVQHLDRDGAPDLRIVCLVDCRHGTLAKTLAKLVAAQSLDVIGFRHSLSLGLTGSDMSMPDSSRVPLASRTLRMDKRGPPAGQRRCDTL